MPLGATGASSSADQGKLRSGLCGGKQFVIAPFQSKLFHAHALRAYVTVMWANSGGWHGFGGDLRSCVRQSRAAVARYAMQPANPLALFKSAGRVAMTGPTPGTVETKRVLFLEYFQSVCTKINDLWQIFLRDKAVQYALSLILASNIFFILLHVFARFMVKFGIADNLAGIVDLNSPLFRIDYDLSFGEFFNYAQTVACAAFLLGVSRITMQPVYRAWAMIFIFVVLDDALKIHEELGHKLSDTFHIGALPGLRAQDTGELLIWAAAGIVLLSGLWRGFVRSAPGARAAGAIVGLAFSALLFFAIGMDMLHVVLGEPGTLASPLLAVIEDGGEMLSIGLACTLALLLYRHPAAAH